MRILNRKEFLAMTGQILFAKYKPQVFGDLQIKVDNCGENDFAVDDILQVFCKGCCCDVSNDLDDAVNDSSMSLNLDMHFTGRDGYFEDDQLFAVFENKDVEQLINRLKEVIQ